MPRAPLIEHTPADTITVWTPPRREALGVTLQRTDRPTAPRDEPAIDRAWARRCAHNPRLFDSPIASVVSFDPCTRCIVWQPDRYRALAVREEIATGAVHLSVMALLVAPDAHARRCVLLAQRSESVAVYPGLWEFGPSGGIDPPRTGAITPDGLIEQLRREIREEIDLDCAPESIAPAMVVRDARAQSLDIACWVQLEAPVSPAASWEYDAVAWVPIDELSAWITRQGPAVCPPTVGVACVLGTLV